MATSPNYGWAEPDNSSLVKNGAQDIRALGDAIDTSLWNVGFGQAAKNKILNSDFSIWQRGTSFALSSTSAYTADRFLGDAGSMAYTFSRQSFTPASAPVSGYEGTYFYRAQAVSGSGGYPKIIQKIEDVRTFAGQAVTLSFWAKASSAITVSPDLIQEFGSGGSSTVYTGVVATSITTSWARYTINYTVPSISGKTIGTGSSLTVSFNLPNSGTASFDTWGWQLEYGSKATPFQTATGTIQGELAACQRYYYQPINGASQNLSMGFMYSASQLQFTLLPPVTMRVAPTIVQTTGTDYWQFNRNGGQDLFNSWTLATASSTAVSLYNNTEISGTAGHAGGIASNNASTTLGFSAEL